MKRATKKIIQRLPQLEKHLNDDESVLLADEVLSKMTDVEKTFLRLCWFFESPDTQNFNLETIYKNLQDDWLEFALASIFAFFTGDTYLIKKSNVSLVTEDTEYLSQAQFAEYLNENGLKYDKKKLNTYLTRGRIPSADLEVGGRKYWLKDTCRAFLKLNKAEALDGQ